MTPLLITIHTTEDGYYRWELRNGPQGSISYAGAAPLLERCFEDILRAQWSLSDHLTDDTDPTLTLDAHTPPDPVPIAQIHPTAGAALPVQQDIPAGGHLTKPSEPFYPHPSSSG